MGVDRKRKGAVEPHKKGTGRFGTDKEDEESEGAVLGLAAET